MAAPAEPAALRRPQARASPDRPPHAAKALREWCVNVGTVSRRGDNDDRHMYMMNPNCCTAQKLLKGLRRTRSPVTIGWPLLRAGDPACAGWRALAAGVSTDIMSSSIVMWLTSPARQAQLQISIHLML